MNDDAEKSANQLFSKFDECVEKLEAIPKEGLPEDEIFERMKKFKTFDRSSTNGTLFAYSYESGDSGKHKAICAKASNMFLETNALNPIVFPSLRRFENDIVHMTLNMLHAPSGSAGIN